MTNYHEEMQKAAEEYAPLGKYELGSKLEAYLAGAAKTLELLGKGEGEHGPRVRVRLQGKSSMGGCSEHEPQFNTSMAVFPEYCPVTELISAKAELLATRARYERELAELRDKLETTEEARVKLDLWAAELHGERDDAREREAKLREALKFYATGFAKKLTDSMMGVNTPALGDGGKIAREALKEHP